MSSVRKTKPLVRAVSLFVTPFLLRLIPDKVGGAIYYRFLKPLPDRFTDLFNKASLRYAPGYSMKVPRSREYMYEMIALFGYFEKGLSCIVADMARTRGGMMVDVGANVGYFSFIWLANQQGNRCAAFEPNVDVFPFLQENIVNNGCGARIVCSPAALSDKKGHANFSKMSDEPTGWGRFASEASESATLVPTDELDNLFPRESIDFLKVDVEGAEFLVFRGGRRLLREKRIKTIYFEQNRRGARDLGIGEQAAWDYLVECGYKVRYLFGSDDKEISDCWAQSD